MWQRLLRLLTATLNAYSFYSNPVRFVTSILLIIVVPYLAYIFWGSVIFVILLVGGIYLFYKFIKEVKRGKSI